MNGMQERGRALKQYTCANEWFPRFAGNLKINRILFNINIILGWNKTFLWLFKVLVWIYMKNTSTFQISQSSESYAQTPGKWFQKVNVQSIKSKTVWNLKRQDWSVIPKASVMGLPGNLCQRTSLTVLKFMKPMRALKIIISAHLPDSCIFLQLLCPQCSSSQNLLPLLNQIMKWF